MSATVYLRASLREKIKKFIRLWRIVTSATTIEKLSW
jgi:hypothetical protein